MSFTDVERVIYAKNPLVEVVCQLRFPRILSINENQPVLFQEKIREKYPLYSVATEWQQEFSLDLAHMSNDAPLIPRVTQAENGKNYRFSSADNNWHINLTPTFLALSTSKYSQWEEFLERLKDPLAALVEVYRPAFYERVGLRYVNVFTRSDLGLEGIDWSELIHSFALGFLSNEQVKEDIKSYNSFIELEIGNGAIAQIRSGLGLFGGIENGVSCTNPELSFILDNDLYFMRKNMNEFDESLHYLHSISTKLIRAIITDKLHNALEPREK